jgi:tetratricopeptide (TPR) repeat protein
MPNILANKLYDISTIDSAQASVDIYKKLVNDFPILYAKYGEISAYLGYLKKDAAILNKAMEIIIYSFSINKEEQPLFCAFTGMAIFYLNSDKKEHINLREHYLETSKQLNNEDSHVYLIYGLHYLQQVNFTKAKENFLLAIQYNQNLLKAYEELLKLAESEEDTESILRYQNEIKRIKKNIPKKFLKLQVAQEEPKKSEEIQKPKKFQVEISQESLNLAKKHFSQGSIFYTKGNYEKAKIEYEKAIKLDSTNAAYHYRLGMVLQDMFLSDKAIIEFKKTIKYDEKFLEAYKSLGILYAQFGDNAKAREAFTQYLKLNPNVKDADKIKKLLSSLR